MTIRRLLKTVVIGIIAAYLLAPPATGQESSPTGAAEASAGEGAPTVTATSTDESLWDKPLPEIVRSIWEMQLFNAGDTAIHLNQIVIALLLVLVGFWVSRRIASTVGSRLIRFKRIDKNAAAAIQKIIFYTLVIVIVLVALPIAGIPITIFTVLGGAVAIGVGFGAQALFNNLISGLIIMTEQPIRLGDIVEVNDHQGRVESIGNRCTRIRRFDGIDVLVPNSHFLENPVVNWTLYDADIRGDVLVGVAYGSPTKQVCEIIERAVREQAKVKKEKEVNVLFEEFGDNALHFRVFFWTDIDRPMDMRHLQSDIRYRIDELCREMEITIAFPQRDVHLDSLKPVEVRLVDRGTSSGSPAAAS